jgi:hypothetical protein
VCVEKCPSEYFAFVKSSFSSDLEIKMICKYEVSVKDKTAAEVEDLIADNKCARYYLKSKEGEFAVCTFSVRSFHKLQ